MPHIHQQPLFQRQHHVVGQYAHSTSHNVQLCDRRHPLQAYFYRNLETEQQIVGKQWPVKNIRNIRERYKPRCMLIIVL